MRKRLIVLALTLLMTLVLMPSVFAADASGTCGDNLTWVLTEDGTLTISGTGDMESVVDADEAWRPYKSSIKSVVIETGVTSIGTSAFGGASMTSVELPEGLTNISMHAFSMCSNLSVINIPESVTQIGEGAFSGCISLTSINVDAGNAYFSNDESGVLYNKDKTALIEAPGATERCIIPATVTAIKKCAFSYCSKLISVEIPEGVLSIEESAFYNCSSLTSVEIPDSVTSIGDSAFSGCSGLTNIVIPDSVTSIGDSAFSHCTGLTEVFVGENVQEIKGSTFNGCTELNAVYICENVTAVGDLAFYNCGSLSDVYFQGSQDQWEQISIGTNNDSLKKANIHYDIPMGTCGRNLAWMLNDGVLTFIGYGTMTDYTESSPAPWAEHADQITAISFNEKMTSIGTYAFAGCTSLPGVTLPEGLLEIPEGHFRAVPQ